MARVIIVDDSPFVLVGLKKFIEEEGHQVIAQGGDGNQAVELYKEHKPDLITLDITMPNKDGRGALTDIIAFDPEASVVMISALAQKDIVVECLSGGAKGYIEKPLKLTDDAFKQEVREVINEALE